MKNKKGKNNSIERNILQEQKYSDWIGKFLPYKRTQTYKKLNKKQKKEFDYHEAKKEVRLKFPIILVFLILLSFIFVKVSFTGNLIKALDSKTFSLFNIVIFAILIIFAIIIYKKFKKK